MLVHVAIQFENPGPEDEASMRSLALDCTNRPDSVRVFPGEKPGWLVVEFTMPDSAQYAAVPRIEGAIRFWGWRRQDSTICFPRTAAEQARAERKAERRRARRRQAGQDT